MIPAKADNHRNQPPAEHIEWFLTDVLLFTHLVHLPAAYASKTYPMNIRIAYFCLKKKEK